MSSLLMWHCHWSSRQCHLCWRYVFVWSDLVTNLPDNVTIVKIFVFVDVTLSLIHQKMSPLLMVYICDVTLSLKSPDIVTIFEGVNLLKWHCHLFTKHFQHSWRHVFVDITVCPIHQRYIVVHFHFFSFCIKKVTNFTLS